MVSKPPPVTSANVLQFRPLVLSIARRWYGSLHKFRSFEELEAIGLEAVWRSLQTWRPDGGASKVTYISRLLGYRFNHELIFCKKNKRAGVALEVDIFERVDVGDGFVDKYQFADGRADALQDLEAKRDQAALAEALKVLPPRLQLVMKRRRAGKKLNEIGSELGVTRERARQLYEDGLVLLRESMVRG